MLTCCAGTAVNTAACAKGHDNMCVTGYVRQLPVGAPSLLLDWWTSPSTGLSDRALAMIRSRLPRASLTDAVTRNRNLHSKPK